MTACQRPELSLVAGDVAPEGEESERPSASPFASPDHGAKRWGTEYVSARIWMDEHVADSLETVDFMRFSGPGVGACSGGGKSSTPPATHGEAATPPAHGALVEVAHEPEPSRPSPAL